MAGWTTLRVAHAPTHRPPAAHKPHRAPPPRIKLSKTKIKSPRIALRHLPFNHYQLRSTQTLSNHPYPYNPLAQPSTGSKPVTFPKSPVTFAEIRSEQP